MKTTKLTENTMRALQGKLIESKFDDDGIDFEDALAKIYEDYCNQYMEESFWMDLVNATDPKLDAIKQWYDETFGDLEESKEIKTESETDEFTFVYDKLRALKSDKWDSVSDQLANNLKDKEINIHFHRGDNELYGRINPADKTTKLTTGSGPNPLDAGFAELLITVKNILDGYTHLHY